MNHFFSAEKFIKIDYKTKKPLKYALSYTEIIKRMSRHRMGDVINPTNIKNFARKVFSSSAQHDAQEFLRYLLSEFQEELNVLKLKPNKALVFSNSDAALQYYFKFNVSIVDRLFAGQLESQVTCKSCQCISSTFDPILDISL